MFDWYVHFYAPWRFGRFMNRSYSIFSVIRLLRSTGRAEYKNYNLVLIRRDINTHYIVHVMVFYARLLAYTRMFFV